MGLKESAIGRFFGMKQERAPYDPNVVEREYFKALNQIFPHIKRIYYPAVGNDTVTFNGLDNNFEIITLDNESSGVNYDSRRQHNYILGDFENTPFKTEIFDAVFIQDIDSDNLGDLFRTLKTGGILIVSDVLCDFDKRPEEYDLIINLERFQGPEINRRYHTFIKKGKITQEDIDNSYDFDNA
jgi:SAM-dependent methyltransferase